jgi:hypothetical protein
LAALLVVIVLFVAFVLPGVIGYIIGSQGTSMGVGWHFGILWFGGVLFWLSFIAGYNLGRNHRHREMRSEQLGELPVGRGHWFHDALGPPDHAWAGEPMPREAGWRAPTGNPYRLRYWDGTRWTAQVLWNGHAWVPF